jgi:hypothetical protein
MEFSGLHFDWSSLANIFITTIIKEMIREVMGIIFTSIRENIKLRKKRMSKGSNVSLGVLP